MSKRKTHEEYVAQVAEINPNIEVTSTYTSNRCNMTFMCKKCGFDDCVRGDILLKPRPCRNCEKNGRIIYGINDFYTLYPHLAMYMEDCDLSHKIGPHSHKAVWFICPDCGTRFLNKPCNITKNGLSCPACSSGRSYPNRLMFNILKNSGIEFTNEFNDFWTEGYLYDFMFEAQGKKYLIEMDGTFHFQDNSMTGISVQETKQHDRYKDNLAERNGYHIIRIDCNYASLNERYQYIKNNIFSSMLSQLINFDTIDFGYCDKLSQKSDFIRICEIYDNETHDIHKISEMVGISHDRIIAHLKHSEEIGCSTYNHNEAVYERNELRKNEVAKSNGNMIYCIETNEIFYSIASAKKCHGGALDRYFRGDIDHAGTLIDGTKLHYNKITEEDKAYLIKYKQAKVFNVDFIRDNSQKELRMFRGVVKCDQTGEYFFNKKAADETYHSHLASYFCHHNKTSGHLSDGTRLTWTKPSIEEVLGYIQNGGILIYPTT